VLSKLDLENEMFSFS